MTTTTSPTSDTTQTKLKGSFTNTLVRTLLIFTFIPLVTVASVLYFRIRAVLLEINSTELNAQITSLTLFTVLVVVVTLAILFFLLHIGAKRISQPLQSLVNIARKFADGDWTQRASVAKDDEFGDLAISFNHMADQLGSVYQSLEKKVDERARQIRTAAEVAQSVTTIPNLDEMLNKTTELLVQEFGFYQASVFITDRGGKYVDYKTGFGPATKELINKQYRLEVGSASIIGWVAAKNQSRIASNVLDDPLHLKNELLPETKAEATIPISLGNNLVLGVLDVQSTQPGEFSPDTIVMLQTLASQIAIAIQTAGLIEASQINFQEVERLYRSSRLIAEANNESEILNVGGQILRNALIQLWCSRLSKMC
ncbi:MAG: GAF domain-containing protein [Anaerolineales bacterium]|nr:GAF domain-containing protein [Anaerolineales bacterium]